MLCLCLSLNTNLFVYFMSKLHYLVFSAVGENKPQTVNQLCKCVSDAGCSIVDSHYSHLGSHFTSTMQLCGDWSAIARVETTLNNLSKKQKVSILMERSTAEIPPSDCLPYTVQVIALDQPGIVYQLTSFFVAQSIQIAGLSSYTYTGPKTSAILLALTLSLHVPTEVHIADLRESFMLLCDDLNLDAIIEPDKPSTT